MVYFRINVMKDKGIQILGYPTNIYNLDGPPSVLHTGEMLWDPHKGCFIPDFYSWQEILKANNQSDDGIIKVWGSIGYATFDIDVVKKCRFKYPKSKAFVWGCDLWYLKEIEAQGYDYWCDTNHRAVNFTGEGRDVSPDSPRSGRPLPPAGDGG